MTDWRDESFSTSRGEDAGAEWRRRARRAWAYLTSRSAETWAFAIVAFVLGGLLF